MLAKAQMSEHRRELLQERLDAFQSMVHREVAVAAALDFCVEYKVEPPDWLVAEARDVLFDLLKGDRSHRIGRSNGPLARFRQDNIDRLRWDVVTYVRDSQKLVAEQVDLVRQRSEEETMWGEDRIKLQAWYGKTLNRAFECASMLLRGSIAFGGPDAMKASYLRVERLKAQGPYQYTIFEYSTLQRLGLEDFAGGLPSTKVTALYHLTL